MPFKRIFINSIHYWIFCGTFISIELFFFWKDPGYSETVQNIFLVLFLISEFLNLMCHLTLKDLRASLETTDKPYGDLKVRSKRGIPKGWGFDYVTCANYTWEVCAWLSFALLVRCYTAYLFLIISFLQMSEWALKKHKDLKAEFDGTDGKPHYPRGRKALIPFVF